MKDKLQKLSLKEIEKFNELMIKEGWDSLVIDSRSAVQGYQLGYLQALKDNLTKEQIEAWLKL